MSPALISFLLFVPFLVVALITGIFFFINGYKKGLWHALISLGMTVLSAVLSVIIANLISSAVAPSLYSLIPADIVDEAGVLSGVVSSLTQGLIRCILSLILFSLILFVLLIITKLVASNIQKDKFKTEEKSLKFAGMGVRALDTLIVTLLMLLPLYGILASYISPVSSFVEATNVLNKNETKPEFEILSVIKNHPLVAAYKNGPTAWVNDSLGGIELSGEKIDPAKIARTMEEVIVRAQEIYEADTEKQLELAKDFCDFLNAKVVKESWCYDLLMGVKGELETYIDLLSPDEQMIARECLGILDMSREDFVTNGEAILDLASYTLEYEILPYINAEEFPDMPSDEFFARVGKVLNVSKQAISVKKFIITCSFSHFFETTNVELGIEEAFDKYYKEVELTEEGYVTEAKSILLMLSGLDGSKADLLEGLILNPHVSNELCSKLAERMLLTDIENNFENPAKVKEFIKSNPEIRTQFSKILAECQSKDHKFAGFSQSYASFKNSILFFFQDEDSYYYGSGNQLDGDKEQTEKLINEVLLPILQRNPNSRLELTAQIMKLFNEAREEDEYVELDSLINLAFSVKNKDVPERLSSDTITRLENGEFEKELEQNIERALFYFNEIELLDKVIKAHGKDPLKLGAGLTSAQKNSLKLMIEATGAYCATNTPNMGGGYITVLPEGFEGDITDIAGNAGSLTIKDGPSDILIERKIIYNADGKTFENYSTDKEETILEPNKNLSEGASLNNDHNGSIVISPIYSGKLDMTNPEQAKENYEKLTALLLDFFGV